jgi:hypothetical protein
VQTPYCGSKALSLLAGLALQSSHCLPHDELPSSPDSIGPAAGPRHSQVGIQAGRAREAIHHHWATRPAASWRSLGYRPPLGHEASGQLVGGCPGLPRLRGAVASCRHEASCRWVSWRAALARRCSFLPPRGGTWRPVLELQHWQHSYSSCAGVPAQLQLLCWSSNTSLTLSARPSHW